jgi:hypothetical protein
MAVGVGNAAAVVDVADGDGDAVAVEEVTTSCGGLADSREAMMPERRLAVVSIPKLTVRDVGRALTGRSAAM